MLKNKIFSTNLVTWQKLGMPYILTDYNLKSEFCIKHSLKVANMPNVKAILHQNTNAQPNLTRRSYSTKNGQENPRVHNHTPQHNIIDKPKIYNAQTEMHTSQVEKNSPSPNVNPLPLPLHQWPAEWKKLLTNKNSAKVLWTYTGLGDDISGQGSEERKKLIRKLIKELAFPTGTHAFFPLSLPQHEDMHLNSQIFWSCAQLLEARAIVVMGSTALNAFNLPRKIRPSQQTLYNGYMIIVLPDINFLINEMHKYAPVREFIRTALRRYVQI